ncbi:cysteine-rich receptor-like protein kinase 6-like protein [Corchorus capsularis]|uniref:Cysteine-rich receptor-like protein kinase 6-like protein n=1 Tax=Corchorus capsularis TaxID=210143 RepID=A0A1R3G5H6_COCAP|nr:cysteine-rich receptor-like protein kinase 6-like protein [Corchorus capsularis]
MWLISSTPHDIIEEGLGDSIYRVRSQKKSHTNNNSSGQVILTKPTTRQTFPFILLLLHSSFLTPISRTTVTCLLPLRLNLDLDPRYSCGSAQSLMGFFAKFCACIQNRLKAARTGSGGEDDSDDGLETQGLFFDLPALQIATNFFSDLNLLGHGGFGPVYKPSQEVQAKRRQQWPSSGVILCRM